jgi:hypothetical protein
MASDTAPSKGQQPDLLPQHVEDLRRSGLSEATIAACRFSSLTDEKAARETLRWRGGAAKLLPALRIPFLDRQGGSSGFARLKPDRPRTRGDGKICKYEQPKGAPVRIYVPPIAWAMIDDRGQPLLITEGEKKAARAAQEGLACVGLTGVNAWSVRREKGPDDKPVGERRLLPELAALPLKGRDVFVVFDSDMAEKKDVRREALALGRALREAGANAYVIPLPAGNGGKKIGLDDYLCRNTPGDLRQLMGAAKAGLNLCGKRKPVFLSPNECAVAGEVSAALAADDYLFQREGTLVRPHVIEPQERLRLPLRGGVPQWERPAGMAVLRPAEPAFVRLRVTAHTLLIKRDAKGEFKAAHPPPWLAPALLAVPGEIRAIDGLLPGPTLDPEGRLIREPGYDATTRWFLASGVPDLVVPDSPSLDEARAAADVLDALICDFPFASRADRSRWLCLLLAAVCRHLMSITPLGLITANVAGAGKTFLARLISIIAHGLTAPILMSWPDGSQFSTEGNEIRKRLASLLQEGASLALMDNLPRGEEFGSDELNAFVTAPAYYDRLLGKNDGSKAGGLNRCLLLATGNNVAPSGDTADRTLLVRLHSDDPNPRSRSPELFTLPDLERHALENRACYLGAALTIWRGWMRAGYPRSPGAHWGTFEEFVGSAVSAVRWLGDQEKWPDPLGDRARCAQELDREWAALQSMILLWPSVLGDQQLSCSQILGVLDPEILPGGAEGADIQAMREALCQLGKCRWPLNTTKLGNVLKAHEGRTVEFEPTAGAGKNKFKLASAYNTSAKTHRYFVEEPQKSPATGVDGGCGAVPQSPVHAGRGPEVNGGAEKCMADWGTAPQPPSTPVTVGAEEEVTL